MNDELTVSEVARELRCSRSAVRKAIARGKLAATLVVVGPQSEYRVERSEVERYRGDHRTPRSQQSGAYTTGRKRRKSGDDDR